MLQFEQKIKLLTSREKLNMMKNYLDWDKMCKPFLNKFDLVLPKPVLTSFSHFISFLREPEMILMMFNAKKGFLSYIVYYFYVFPYRRIESRE